MVVIDTRCLYVARGGWVIHRGRMIITVRVPDAIMRVSVLQDTLKAVRVISVLF